MTKGRKRGGQLKAAKAVSLAQMPFGGDHGANTPAALAGTKLRGVLNDQGKNPNNLGQRYKVEVIQTLSLDLKQLQAATALRDAYCRVQQLSSGNSEVKVRVQSSPVPDASIDRQVDAVSEYVHIMRGVNNRDIAIIGHVCFENMPLRRFTKHSRQGARIKQALDRVAVHMKY